MAGFDTVFQANLAERLKNAVADETYQIVDVSSPKDWADYRYRCGKIAGYRAALDLMAEVHKELMGDDRK